MLLLASRKAGGDSWKGSGDGCYVAPWKFKYSYAKVWDNARQF